MRAQPAAALLSNGSYAVMITGAAAGYSTWRNLDVTRWREDATRDCWGQFYYLRDLGDNDVWSIGAQPLPNSGPPEYEFHPDRAEFRQRHGTIEAGCSVCVVPDTDAEIRAITLTNESRHPHEIELTSYLEVCLNDRRADRAHPAFAKLFLETEFDPQYGALLARRRPRGANEKPVWAFHTSSASVPGTGDYEYETDRARFLGRGRTPGNPAALDPGICLSRTTGPVLDPIFSLRRRIRLEGEATIRMAFITGAAETRDGALVIANRFREFDAVGAALAAARNHVQAELRKLELSPEEVELFNRLSTAVVFTDSGLRDLVAAANNKLDQSALWLHSISGDLPIVLVRVEQGSDETLARQLLQWHAYARLRGLKSDLVILDKRSGEPADRLRTEIRNRAGDMLSKPGGVFPLNADTVPADHASLLAAAARVVLDGNRGSLRELTDRLVAPPPMPLELSVPISVATEPVAQADGEHEELSFWNGFGGFTSEGREYVIAVDGTSPNGANLPPAPWTNVLANPQFGCLATEGGLGYSWAGNSQMNRLTPWSNDPTSDPSGEVTYIRDEESGDVWTPTPLPLGPRAKVTVRHGQGYTRYSHVSRSLNQDLLVFVPSDDPIKLVWLTLQNRGDRPRRLSATYYAEWVLTSVRENAPMQVVCERDAETGAILARNSWAGDFAGKIAFVACDSPQSITADRTEFLGDRGSIATPIALRRIGLSGRTGPGLDPCAAIRTEFTLAPGETKEVIFALGEADNLGEVRRLVREYTQSLRAESALAEVRQQWDRCLDSLHVKTPDPAMDLMLNRWLLYQVRACRVWARSAFYQSGGAYGFRDQLQDVMALVYSVPTEARTQILRSAAHQFEEGDVQHWWHPPSGVGVRTRITDDLYFLPFVVHHYATTTGDTGILDEVVPFIASPVLREDQEETFGLPSVSSQSSSLYDHCLRALKHGFRLGSHGLPLMGTGDWNDGMNKVGAHGKGESVFNGWFFVRVLTSFAELAQPRCKSDADWCRECAEQLRVALEANAWDGAWYRRAYFDDGTPLGSSQNSECQIAAIPQAWSVISGAASPERAQSAMNAVQKRLVRLDDKLIELFDPPFDDGVLQPGYIKGYVPGIRENGGQYTHAATWVVLATALQGQGDRAMELWRLINPITHASTPEAVKQYKVEPYVVCADVYSAPPHTGRGGWTWYTGSAGWLYRVAIESMLGFQLRGTTLSLDPCVPPSWPAFELSYRHHSATYRILVDNSSHTGRGVCAVELDGQQLPQGTIPLSDDSKTHTVRVRLG